MPQPTPYTPTTDFSQQEANNASGRSTVNTAALDAEFANIETTLDQVVSNLNLIQRDDGKLGDVTVDVRCLSQDVLNVMGGFNLTGLWTPATAYQVNDICSNGEYTYVCKTAHTSGGSFSATNWIQFGFTAGADAAQAAANAQASASAAATSQASALSSANTATTQAASASASASSASASASSAAASAGAASTSATNAANSAAAAAVTVGAISLPIAVTSGGTGATTAANARTNLGLGSLATYNIDSFGAFSHRNRIINGNFDVWQRGTSFVNPAGVYAADRWFATSSNSTLSRVTNSGGFGTFAAALTANSATNLLLISQALEASECNALKGRRVTLSFAYSASVNQPASSLVISVQRNGTADTITGGTWTTLSAVSGATTYTPTTGVQYAALTVDVPSDATANGIRVNIQTTNITNGSSVYVFNVQLETGVVATPFERRPLQVETALCQRYYEIVRVSAGQYNATAGNTCAVSVPFKVTKRAAPSVSTLTSIVSSNVSSATYDNISVEGARYVIAATGAGANAAVADAVAVIELT